MSKIIAHGKTYKIKTCEKCECKFGYGKIDIEYEKFEDYVNNFEYYYTKCPECGEKCFIDIKEDKDE